MSRLLAGAAIGIGVMAAAGSLSLTIGTPSHPQPGFFPFVAALLLVAASSVCLARARGEGAGDPLTDQPQATSSGVRAPAAVLAALCVATVLVDRAGFVPAAAVASGTVTLVLGSGSWHRLLVAGLALPAVVYLVFRAGLGVDLPAGPFGP